jgi:pimeloyl-ACP methyl ester carboxylesterase
MKKMESIYFDTNGIRLHAIQAGPEGGRLIILLHGFPEFWRSWIHQIEPLATAGHFVLAPDQRGYNLSDKPQDIAAFNLGELSKDIAGLIRTAGRQKAVVVGHDWGGVVAWWLGVYFPEMLERLVVLNAPHPGVMRQMLVSNPDQIRRSSYAFFFQLPWIPEAVSRNNDWELLERSLRETSRPGTFSQQDFEHYRQAWWRKGAFTAMLNWYRANLRFLATFPEDTRISVPTLLLWGTQDFALGQQMAAASIEMCDQGQLVLFEDATHWIQHEEAEQVNQLIIEFASENKR